MHNHMDDLRGYEQALLALHHAPRRRGNTTLTGPAVTHPPPPAASATAPAKRNTASPAGSSSSSGRGMSAGSSRGSSFSSGGSQGTDDASRPTFNCLPLQTLSPEYTKRSVTVSILSGAYEGFSGVVSEQEQKMQERGLEGIADRHRRMSFPSGRIGAYGPR